ncbi:unnamed protein product, partial [Polarella glacialis]
AKADDNNDVAWRSTGHMLYCLDSRYFHQGSGQNHPLGDRKICSGDCIRVVLDCSRHTVAFGFNNEKPIVLFRDLEPTFYFPAVDLRDCGDKIRILSQRGSRPHVRPAVVGGAASSSRSPAPTLGAGQLQHNPLHEVEPGPQMPLPSAGTGGSRAESNAPMTPPALSLPAANAEEPDAPPPSDPPPSRRHTAPAVGEVPSVHQLPGVAFPLGHSPASGSSNPRMLQPRQSQAAHHPGLGSPYPNP